VLTLYTINANGTTHNNKQQTTTTTNNNKQQQTTNTNNNNNNNTQAQHAQLLPTSSKTSHEHNPKLTTHNIDKQTKPQQTFTRLDREKRGRGNTLTRCFRFCKSYMINN